MPTTSEDLEKRRVVAKARGMSAYDVAHAYTAGLQRRGRLVPNVAAKLAERALAFTRGTHQGDASNVVSWLDDYLAGEGSTYLEPRHKADPDSTPMIDGLRAFGVGKDRAERMYRDHAARYAAHGASGGVAAYYALVQEGMADYLKREQPEAAPEPAQRTPEEQAVTDGVLASGRYRRM